MAFGCSGVLQRWLRQNSLSGETRRKLDFQRRRQGATSKRSTTGDNFTSNGGTWRPGVIRPGKGLAIQMRCEQPKPVETDGAHVRPEYVGKPG